MSDAPAMEYGDWFVAHDGDGQTYRGLVVDGPFDVGNDEHLLHVEWDSELVERREDLNAVGRATIDTGDDEREMALELYPASLNTVKKAPKDAEIIEVEEYEAASDCTDGSADADARNRGDWDA